LIVAGKSSVFCKIKGFKEGMANVNGNIKINPSAMVWDNTWFW
jgi:hypothetical protein